MKSTLPKVLTRICGRPMIAYVLDTLEAFGSLRPWSSFGSGLIPCARPRALAPLRGSSRPTGYRARRHAGVASVGHGTRTVLVLNGDLPFVTTDTLTRLTAHASGDTGASTILTMSGRPCGLRPRDSATTAASCSASSRTADATAEERAVREINVGAYAVRARAAASGAAEFCGRPMRRENTT